jgi:hypothetical protein
MSDIATLSASVKNIKLGDNSDELEEYFKFIELKIIKLFKRDEKETVLSDILLAEYISKNKDIIIKAFRLKKLQMKIGFIWQFIIGNYPDFKDLGVGHKSGLDIISTKRKIIIELKNRYNTDNANSRLANYNKLAKYKTNHSAYTCIYGVINDKKSEGQHKSITHNGVEIIYCSGDKLFTLIFADNKNEIIRTIKRFFNEVVNK